MLAASQLHTCLAVLSFAAATRTRAAPRMRFRSPDFRGQMALRAQLAGQVGRWWMVGELLPAKVAFFEDMAF